MQPLTRGFTIAEMYFSPRPAFSTVTEPSIIPLARHTELAPPTVTLPGRFENYPTAVNVPEYDVGDGPQNPFGSFIVHLNEYWPYYVLLGLVCSVVYMDYRQRQEDAKRFR